MARSSASSRLRWATRIENVLMMRKIADDQGDPGEDQQEGLQEAEDLVEARLVLLDVGVAGARHHAVGQHLLRRVGQLCLGDAVGRVEGDRAVDVPAAEEPLLHELAVEDRQGRAVRARLTELDRPVSLAFITGGWPGVASSTSSPISKPPFSAASTSSATWFGPLGQSPWPG